ncbi:GNAT family N-acetyltransferase [Legionella sp. WA2022007384]
MKKIVEVVPYNPLWPELFAAEAFQIKQTLGDNCIAIHHIGSTSVPGLSAKPIIDILPVVRDILLVDNASKAMENIGYSTMGEHGIPFRRFFQKGVTIRTHNVHVFEKNNSEIERHLSFTDWMRAHQDDRDAYATLKIALAKQFPHDITAYCLGKEEFITNIDAQAGFTKLRIVKALTHLEWQLARAFRQKYFFDKVPVSDPYTWTFDHKDHIHFVLYQGTIRVGYAHIQLWPNQRAALRIIVIDEAYRNKGIGSDFLNLIEKWLQHTGIIKLHIQSSPEAINFYLHHQYVNMPFDDPDHHESDPRDIEIGKIL